MAECGLRYQITVIAQPGKQSVKNQPGAYDSPASYFEAVYQIFQYGEQADSDSNSHFFNIDGQTINLRFAGSALTPRIIPALEHLRGVPTTSPQLTIYLWDSASTHYPFPLHPWSGNASSAFGEEFHSDEGRIHFNDGRFRMYFYMDDMILMLDSHKGKAIFWVEDAQKLPYHESGAPLRSLLDWWFSNNYRQFVHAAALGTDKGGVLLIGKGGSGKSTTTLACLDSPLQIAGDDYCLLTSTPSPYVKSLYSTAKMDPLDINRLPHLRTDISNADRLDSEKALFFLYKRHPKKIIKGFPLRALLIPRITGGTQTSIKPASSIASLMALAPSTIFQLVNEGSTSFGFMSRLVREVPSFYLDLGTDLAQIPATIMELLSNYQ